MARALCLISLLVSLGCRPGGSGSVRIDPALATLVPGDAVFLAGVRMDAVRSTPMYRKWVANRPAPFLDNFARETGLDPRRDLWELLFVSGGAETLVMARGEFAPQGLEPKLEREGARRIPYKGYTLLGGEEAAVAFMNATTAVAGPAAAVRAVIDQRNRPAAPPVLLDRVKSIPSHNQVWAVSGGSPALAEKLPRRGNLANLGKILTMLESSTIAADLRSGLNISANGVCRTEQEAGSLASALRGFVGLARFSAPRNRPDLARLWDLIRIEQQDRSVRVEAAISEDLLDQLFAWASGSAPAGQPRSDGK